PENTLAAFELAVRQGADAFELDVRLTADGVPVVLHDPTLERTTDHTGPLAALRAAALKDIDAGARFTLDRGKTFPFRAADVRIPTLTEILREFPEMPVLLEIKEVAAQEAVRQVLIEEKAVERCVLASENHAALQLFREPPFATAASAAEIGVLYRAVLFRRVPMSLPYRLLSVPVRHRGLPVPTRSFVAASRGLGCPVHVWTVNDAATALTLWGRGVAGIVTNLPDVIWGARKQ
ncbi:MAG TPA: glycerophosphodiester phosphodiesterase family protein, partial [Gemmatimonadales bacterium]|nr:glycerophosphodiester phosphodiesterase family protein [Gemmatimonadales bacterium]